MTTPQFLTLRQVAKTGLLPERALRALQKRGLVPGVYSGRTYWVNYPALLEVLDKMSREGVQM